jgi:hypothetical protein
VDEAGQELDLRDLVEAAEASGVRLFIVASQNRFDKIKEHIHLCRVVSFMTIVERNRHFPAFLRGILAGLSKDPNFALAYINLAPQHQDGQQGLPLPGSIAMCTRPGKRGLVLWSNAQP